MSNDVHCWHKKRLTTPGVPGIEPGMASTRKTLATLDDLRPDPENPREISAEALDGLAVSVAEFGDISGIVWNARTGHLVAGHQRVKALVSKGATLDVSVPALVMEGAVFPVRVVDWDQMMERAANVTANNPHIAGDFTTGLEGVLAGLKDCWPTFEDLRLDNLLGDTHKAVAQRRFARSAGEISHKGFQEMAPTAVEMERLRGREILMEFSGGMDSSAAAIWAKRYLSAEMLQLLYVDLGADHVGFMFHLHDFAQWLGAPLQVLRAKQNLLDVMLRKGEWPRFAHGYCHGLLLETLDEEVKRHDSGAVVIMRGGRLAERSPTGGRSGDRFCAVARMADYTYFQPLYFADKELCEKTVRESGAPIWAGYERGLLRTACRICPGQRMPAYAAIRREMPDVWGELIEMERRLGPGCWSDPVGNVGRGALAELADRADSRSDRGDFDSVPG